MTTSLRFCYRNDADIAIISTGSAPISSLPAANLKDEDIEKVWRSSGSAGDAVIVDLGGQLEVGVIALLNCNIGASDTVRFRLSVSDPTGVDGSAFDTGDYAPNVDPVWEKLMTFVEPAAVGRYVRISLSITTPPIEAGRLVVGPTWIPSRHFSFGFQPLWRDASRRTYSLGQNVFTDVQKRARGYRFVMRGLTTDEINTEIAELNRQRGIGHDVLVCLNKDTTNLGRDTLWGLLEEPLLPTQTERDLWEVEGSVWERL